MTAKFARVGAIGLLVAALFGGMAVTEDHEAGAAQYIAVYAPENHGTYVQGWANIKPGCTYYQCAVYLKIERSSWTGWRFLAGNFVPWTNSWVSMKGTKLTGCYDYRTTLEIYSWTLGQKAAGVNLGPVGVTASGQTIYKYKFTWSSGKVRYCR